MLLRMALFFLNYPVRISQKSCRATLDKAYDNITVKKIPQMLLERCEFGKADYNLNIVHPPVYDDCDEEEEDV